MNGKHLKAILWLRWRILRNRTQRSGKASRVFMGFLLIAAVCLSVALFAGSIALGIHRLPVSTPFEIFVAWLALCLAFLFSWTVGLLSDLQRSDAMSFKNLLHLPVSLSWVFLYNYLSSFVSLSVMIFVPAMFGLLFAMVWVDGPMMVLALPLLIGFLGMVTAITYQLRGWLARLMEDKRRGRNIVSLLTLLLVLLAQAPNLINMSVQSDSRAERAELRELRNLSRTDGPGQALAIQKLALLEEQEVREDSSLKASLTLGAQVLPIGWLPIGMRAASERRWFVSLLCGLGMLSIGSWSLRRSYRKTLQGAVKGGGAATPVPVPIESNVRAEPSTTQRKPSFVERPVPFVNARVAGIARTSLLSFVRAPEAKLMLLSPIILLGLYGYILVQRSSTSTFQGYTSFLTLGAVTMGMLSVMHMIQNQFGLDRGGFRAYLLSPTPRAEILLGKNIAMAPIAFIIGFAALTLVQVLMPLGALHLLGACFQLASAYLMLCMLWNLISIISPIRLKDNGMKPANASFKGSMIQLGASLLVPVVLLPLIVPAIAEKILGWQHTPLFTVLHLLILVAVFLIYRLAIRHQGLFLQAREQRILITLTQE
ncbi:MAG: hypothetical protein JKY61_03770 [Planctomycetes bacterium]|nr:hypothetical protein [Planctomycetota bacterium]